MAKKAKIRKEIRIPNPKSSTYEKVKLLAEKQNNSIAGVAELLIDKQLALIEL